MELKDKFLPIGSVVLLKGGNKKIMVTGFCSVEGDNEKIYDYCGCIYPEGYLSPSKICLFDHNQISELLYLGYSTEEDQNFKSSLNKLVEKYKNGEYIKNTEKDLDYL